MFNNAVLEVFRNHLWDIYPPVVSIYKDLLSRRPDSLERNVKSEEEPSLGAPYLLSSRNSFQKKIFIKNFDGSLPSDEDDEEWEEVGTPPEVEDDERIINVMKVDGPILRNAGMCSYGSKGHRDLMKNAADDKRTIGHLFVIDSPGGSADAKYDYEEGIEYVRSKGQPVIAFINGMAGSAAYALASLCDEVYYAGEGDSVGCIGSMAAGYFMKDGDTNLKSGETYFERYAEGSPYKNREYRSIVNGDDTIVMNGLNKSCKDFQEMVRRMRPNVTDEQLKGDMYRAKNVEGTMVDRKNTYQGCIDRINALHDGKATLGIFDTDPREPEGEPEVEIPDEEPKNPDNSPEVPEDEPETNPEETTEGEKPKTELKEKSKKDKTTEGEEEPEEDGENPKEDSEMEEPEENPEGEDGSEDDVVPASKKTTPISNNQKHTNVMENVYPLIMESAELNALCADREAGIYLQKEHAENVEKTIKELRQKENVLQAKMVEIKRLNEQIESLKKANENALAERDAAYVEKEKGLNEKLQKSEETVSRLNSEIKEKDEQIDALSNSAVESPKPQDGAPKSNASAPAAGENVAKSIYDENMTLAEKVIARKEREEYLKKGIGI